MIIKTIEQLENVAWPEPEYDSYVVLESHKIRKIPISELTIEQLRLCLNQDNGVKFIIDRVYEVLEFNSLASGDLYEGDLVKALISSEYFNNHNNPSEVEMIKNIAMNAIEQSSDEDLIHDIKEKIIRKGI